MGSFTTGCCKIVNSTLILGTKFRKAVNLFRMGVNFFGNQVNLFRLSILRNRTFFDRELMRSSLGVLSVVGRWNRAKYKRSKRDGILIKRTFCNLAFFGRSLVCPWFILGLLHRVDIQGTREQNLNKKNFCQYSFIWRSCLPCTALPYSHTAAYPQGVRHSMYCA